MGWSCMSVGVDFIINTPLDSQHRQYQCKCGIIKHRAASHKGNASGGWQLISYYFYNYYTDITMCNHIHTYIQFSLFALENTDFQVRT